MKRYRKIGVLFFFSIIISMFVFPPKAYADSNYGLKLTIHTVIDNIDEVPDSIRDKNFYYNVDRITKLTARRSRNYNYALAPDARESKSLKWKHDDETTIFYRNITTTIDTIWFNVDSEQTDSHLSLESIEFGTDSNLRKFTYDDDGWAKKINPYDWLEVIDDRKKEAEVTLHFKYNPDIEGIKVESPGINPSYSKKIDYLGDKTFNPGTEIAGDNFYRLYLDLNSGDDWRTEEDKEKDIIFVLDVSGSMAWDFGSISRIDALKQTMRQAINSLAENENNKISIITFGTNANTIISGSNNKGELLEKVNSIRYGGWTNFYDALKLAEDIVEENAHREKSIFFISDGEPNTALSAGSNRRRIENNETVALSYTNQLAKDFPKVKDFFSIYIGEEEGYASILQTMTQRISVDNEQYMIKTTNPDQLDAAFDRYMTRFGVVFRDVTIVDELTEYADYVGNMKVHMEESGKEKVELKKDADYEILVEDNSKVSIKLLIDIKPETIYELSFDIQASDKALAEYDSTGIYPHIGDSGTNYPGNMTSDGKEGFYSNEAAELSYNTGDEMIVEKYPKPVLQINEYNPIEEVIEFEKNLTGKDLETNEFEFELKEIQKDGDTGEPFGTRVGNNHDGTIQFGTFKFIRPGRHSFEVKEVVPANKKPGYIYDDRVLNFIVDVTKNERDILEASVSYPDGTKFLNRYKAEPISVNFELKKELLKKELNAGDYQFRLFDGNMEPIEVVSNQANGEIIFSPIEFNKSSVYQFIVKEIVPNPMDPNTRYDLSPSNIEVKVTDVGGKLKADISYGKEKFVNRYQKENHKKETDLAFEVILSGMQLSPGMFEFELAGDNVDSLKTTNRSDGNIIFQGIKFEEPGEYNYTVKQIIPDNSIEHMNYDEKVRKITVEVTRNSDGELIVAPEYDPDNKFYNRYNFSGRIW